VVNKDVPPGKLAVGAPARAIRESPQRRRKKAGRGGSADNETEG
jgi:bifunctional UDP-N-acetylglucosamine pyrophosphorylase / glucosamine-1-phosphate N-acetyltransferase